MKILFCTKRLPEVPQRLRELLPEHEIVVCSIADVPSNLPGTDVLIPSGTRVGRDVIEAGQFGFIQQNGVGLEKIDAQAATDCGVFVSRVPGAGSGNAEGVAELGVWLMLSLARRTPEAIEGLRRRQWTTTPIGMSLLNKTVCIVGLGDSGSELAVRLQPFGMRITAVRQHPEKSLPGELKLDRVYGPSQLTDAVGAADFVVLTLMHSPKTQHVINAEVLAAMKRGAYVVNLARGGVMDTDALLQALRSGHIAGAGLDVFEEEPIDPAHPIFKENVVATPHIGGDTDEALIGITERMAENIRRFAAGERPLWSITDPPFVRGR